MREDLLGYLMSALEPHEMRQVEQELRARPALREELEYLQRTIAPIDRAIAVQPVIETPIDLVARTMAIIPPMLAGTPSGSTISLTPATESGRTLRHRWADLMVAGAAAAAVLCLLIPTIARERYEARKLACQDHLRQLGTAITAFVLQDHRNLLPKIAEEGSEAFAGMYAVRLADHDLLQEAALKWCPDIEKSTAQPADNSALLLVKSHNLHQANERNDIDGLRLLQQSAGGNYAYTLGVVDGGRYDAPRYEGRSQFAVLGDTPISGTEVGDDVVVEKLRWSHGDNGANLLFEDGRVQFVDMSSGRQFPDHPFFNHRGSFEAGVNIDDASLAPSWRPPFIPVRQR